MNFIQNINNLIQREDWKLSNGILYRKKVAWLPIIKIDNNVFYIYFNKRLANEIVRILRHYNGEEIYMISPIFSDPKVFRNTDIDSYHEKNLDNYLKNYVSSKFYYQFKKIGFDLVSNLVSYCQKNDCFYLLKEIYDVRNKIIQNKSNHYYTGQAYYRYDEEIRNEFNSLYRQIRINQILND